MNHIHFIDLSLDCHPKPGITEHVSCRLQHEISTREQLWSKCSDLDARLSKMAERNEHLVEELRAKESAAATASGQHLSHSPCCICDLALLLSVLLRTA